MAEEFKLNIPTMKELEEQMVGGKKAEKKQTTEPKKDMTPLVNRLKAIRNQIDDVIDEIGEM